MKKELFYVGTYAEPNNEGIFLYEADFENHTFTRLASCSGVPNPSYLLKRRNGLLYSVEELASGGNISAFMTDSGGFDKVCTLPSRGADPCHLALDDNERFLFVANYSSGSLAMFELDSAGLPLGICEFIKHTGSGADPIRQSEPHVHYSEYHDGMLFVCDLGLDTIFCYGLNPEKRTLEKTGLDIRIPSGNGARHMAFHPSNKAWMFVIGELTGNVFVYHLENGKYILKQEIHSLPENALKDNRSAAIKLSDDGGFLFVSNRGSDTITAYSVTEEGTLNILDICKTGGKAPRDFTLFGDNIIIANQDSKTLTALHFNRSNNLLEPLNMQEEAGQPVCILRY